jgi:hypothetical protein
MHMREEAKLYTSISIFNLCKQERKEITNPEHFQLQFDAIIAELRRSAIKQHKDALLTKSKKQLKKNTKE